MPEDLRDDLRLILAAVRDACDREQTDELRYVSEWLGTLPFGLYAWVSVGAREGVDQAFPTGWSAESLDRLAAGGYLDERSRRRQAEDLEVVYRLTAAGRAAASPDKRRCWDCGKWFDLARDPHSWSVNMCSSCAMDRASDIADRRDS